MHVMHHSRLVYMHFVSMGFKFTEMSDIISCCMNVHHKNYVFASDLT